MTTKKVLVGDDDAGAEGEDEYSADRPLASLSSLSNNPTRPLLLLLLLFHLLLLISLLLGSLALFTLVWQRDEDLDVVEREESRLAVQHSLVPVLVDLIGQGDDIALVEAQLSLVLRLEVVQRLTARLLRG